MNKNLIIGLMLCLLLAGSVLAAGEVDDFVSMPGTSSTDYYQTASGAPLASIGWDTMSLADKLRFGSATGGGLTMIDGALCSTYPNTEKSYTPSSTSTQNVCTTNEEHIGVAWQIFNIRDDGSWDYQGERQLSTGERGCFPVEYGKDYILHWYHCDEQEKACTNYQSVSSCEDPAWTVRERICTTGTNTQVERVTVDYYDPNAPQGCAEPEDNNPPQTGGSGGDTGNDGSGDVSTCQGDWLEVAFPENVRPGDKYSGFGTFKAAADGECIFSSVMQPVARSSLSVALNAQGSACGQPDAHVAEVKTSVTAGETYIVNFKDMEARDDTGVYDVYVGAWNGCFIDGGTEQDATFQPVNVLTLKGEIDRQLAAYGGLGAVLIGFAVVFLIVGVVLWAKKD